MDISRNVTGETEMYDFQLFRVIVQDMRVWKLQFLLRWKPEKKWKRERKTEEKGG